MGERLNEAIDYVQMRMGIEYVKDCQQRDSVRLGLGGGRRRGNVRLMRTVSL